MWYRNNIIAMGKWGGASFLFGVAVTAFVFNGNTALRVHAYVLDTIPTSSYQQTEFKLNLNPVGKITDITAPVGNLISDAIKGLRLNQVLDIGTGTPLSPIKSPSQNTDFSKFFSSSKVSANDITGFLKEAAITGVKLTILIISVTSQVLRGLLEAIK